MRRARASVVWLDQKEPSDLGLQPSIVWSLRLPSCLDLKAKSAAEEHRKLCYFESNNKTISVCVVVVGCQLDPAMWFLSGPLQV